MSGQSIVKPFIDHIEAQAKRIEELEVIERKMQCLYAAGIDNCEAYDIAMQEFYADEED